MDFKKQEKQLNHLKRSLYQLRIQKPMDFRKLIKMINENINNEE